MKSQKKLTKKPHFDSPMHELIYLKGYSKGYSDGFRECKEEVVKIIQEEDDKRGRNKR